MTIFVMAFLPETKNVPIEEIQERLIMRHWCWGRVVKDYWGEGGVRRWSEQGSALEAGKAGAGKGGVALNAAAA
jgi:hypothetical protein